MLKYYKKEEKIYPTYISQDKTQIVKKKNYPFDDFKQKDGIMLKLKKIM